MIEFFKKASECFHIEALGICCFGPIDPIQGSPTYGHITTTPKLSWANYDIVGEIRRELRSALKIPDSDLFPIGFDTDVNGSALGESRWGAAQGLDTFLYLTVGTGIGAGALVHGNLLHGMMHPEFGHMMIPRDKSDQNFEGSCPYHGSLCLEGLASGPAVQKRWGEAGFNLPEDHAAWPLEAKYLGLALANAVLVLSPQRIIMGGGVMLKPGLIELVQKETRNALNGYIDRHEIKDDERLKQYIVLPGLGGNAGLCGSFALARIAQTSKLLLSNNEMK